MFVHLVLILFVVASAVLHWLNCALSDRAPASVSPLLALHASSLHPLIDSLSASLSLDMIVAVWTHCTPLIRDSAAVAARRDAWLQLCAHQHVIEFAALSFGQPRVASGSRADRALASLLAFRFEPADLGRMQHVEELLLRTRNLLRPSTLTPSPTEAAAAAAAAAAAGKSGVVATKQALDDVFQRTEKDDEVAVESISLVRMSVLHCSVTESLPCVAVQAYLFVCCLFFPLCRDATAWENEVHARLLLRHSSHGAFALVSQAIFAAAVRWIHGAWHAMQLPAACSITEVGANTSVASVSSSPPTSSPTLVPRFAFATPAMQWATLFTRLKKRASGTPSKDTAGGSLKVVHAAMEKIYKADAEAEAKRKEEKRAAQKANGAAAAAASATT